MTGTGSRSRLRARIAALLVASLALLGGECGLWDPIVAVTTPGQGASLTRMPLTIELALLIHADPETLVVRLNGTDVTGLFTVDPPIGSHRTAWADFVWGSALVLPGANLIEAEVRMHGILYENRATFETGGDPYADAVTSTVIGASGGFNQAFLPDVVLGPPAGNGLFGGTLDVFSLGLEGEIVVAFDDNVIVDGPGVDFTVFENPFFETGLFEIIENLFSEAGSVGVSQDGITWFEFPCAGAMEDHPFYPGCAGVYPVLADGETDERHPSVPTAGPPVESFFGQAKSDVVVPEGSGGDSFDLADVGLPWARYVRIRAADHVVGPFGTDNAGFDLDAVAAVNSLPATDADGNGVPDAVE